MEQHFDFLLAAYSIIFVGIFLYIVFIRSRQRRLETEIHTLEAKLRELSEVSVATPPAAKRSRNS
jgi:CcmD family protein